MLRRLRIKGFKSLYDVELNFPRLTVLFGPNAAGKSNILDAIELLSSLGTERTLMDAFENLPRGYPLEAFSFPGDSLPGLIAGSDIPTFSIEADLGTGRGQKELYRYNVGVGINPRSGALSVTDEHLTKLNRKFDPIGQARIEVVNQKVRVRRAGSGRPIAEPLGQHFTALSDPRFSGTRYRPLDLVRSELLGWRTYYLDPRLTMRRPQPPSAVSDIGTYGHLISPFLFRLHAEYPRHFDSIKRTMRSLIPSLEDLKVELNQRQGTLDILIKQAGAEFSSRIVSEGTLRLLALCCIAVNPWSEALVALEEPENGVHPRRLELIADLIVNLALQGRRQVVITTHSLQFCDAVLRMACDDSTLPREARGQIGLLKVRQVGHQTLVSPFDTNSPLFRDTELRKSLTAGTEDGLFGNVILRAFDEQ